MYKISDAKPIKSKSSKNVGPGRNAHTANTKYGMGDYYGTAVKNNVGRMREDQINDIITPDKLKRPPKNLA